MRQFLHDLVVFHEGVLVNSEGVREFRLIGKILHGDTPHRCVMIGTGWHWQMGCQVGWRLLVAYERRLADWWKLAASGFVAIFISTRCFILFGWSTVLHRGLHRGRLLAYCDHILRLKYQLWFKEFGSFGSIPAVYFAHLLLHRLFNIKINIILNTCYIIPISHDDSVMQYNRVCAMFMIWFNINNFLRQLQILIITKKCGRSLVSCFIII